MKIEDALKEAIKADAFYIEPKDENIVYLNLTRLDNILLICKDYLKKQREICAKRADNCLAVNENKYFGNLNLAILNSPEPE